MFTKFQTLISKPGHLFRYKSLFIRKLYFNISTILHFKTFLKRRFKKSNIRSLHDGYIKFNPNDLNKLGIDVEKIINEIQNKIVLDDININTDKSINVLLSSKDFKINSFTFNFITNKHIIDIVSKYIGMVPLLTHISYWYSPNLKKINDSSQEFHLDHEDFKQVKGFFLLEDIDENNGPTKFINSKISKKIINKINYKTSSNLKRINENIITKFSNDSVISCTGKKVHCF